MVSKRFTAKQLRIRANLTQLELAIAIGKQPSTISDWERRVHIPHLTPSETQALMIALKCSLEDLIFAYEEDVDDEGQL